MAFGCMSETVSRDMFPAAKKSHHWEGEQQDQPDFCEKLRMSGDHWHGDC